MTLFSLFTVKISYYAEFAVIKGFCETRESVATEYQRFVHDMKNPSSRAVEFIKNYTAITYWLQIGYKVYTILGKIAQIVCKVPTSQTASERAWSIFDFILTKRRNRLIPEKFTCSALHEC